MSASTKARCSTRSVKVSPRLRRAWASAWSGVDLVLASADLAAGRLVTPFKQAVATGDGYYMTWLKNSPKARQMQKLRDFLLGQVPPLVLKDINYLYS